MSSKLKTFFSITIVIILTIVFHYIGWLSSIENYLHKLIKPESEALYALSVSINGDDIFNNEEELKKAYKNLKNELIKNKIDIVQLQLLRDENEELKKELNFIKQTSYTSIGVNVIGKNSEPTGNTLIIDRGSLDNIKLGNIVITGEGILIGKLTKVEENFSIIRLINDNQSKIAATIMNQEKSVGLIEGGYGISVHMNFIPQNEVINIGDTVVTSGLEDGVPRGLLVGKIEAIEKEAYQPFQKAVISPLVNLDKITMASVILQPND